jgi:hypothetical protein
MAVPLWRQYARLTPEERRSIIGRRRRELDNSSSREDILAVFQQDERDIRNFYRSRGESGVPDPAAAAAEGAANVDNSPFGRQQRAFADLNDSDRRLARDIAGRTSIPIEDIPGELAGYRSQVSERVTGRSPAEIDAIVADSLARNFPK